MIVGDPAVFAIESDITEAYERLSFRALGYFAIHVGGHRYGRCATDATMLACSFDEVGRRLAHRGAHIAPFAETAEAEVVASAVRSALYAPGPDQERFFGYPRDEFAALVYSRHLVSAPDGDEAFDDSSYVLQFDCANRVRLIAFRSSEGYGIDAGTLRESWLEWQRFYKVLEQWQSAFEQQWAGSPKMAG